MLYCGQIEEKASEQGENQQQTQPTSVLAGALLWSNWKTREPGEKASEQGEDQQTQPTCGNRPKSNPGYIGGRRALTPLCHPC